MTGEGTSPRVDANDAQKARETEGSYAEAQGSEKVPAELSKTQPLIDPKTKTLKEQRQERKKQLKHGRETIDQATSSARPGRETIEFAKSSARPDFQDSVPGPVDRIRKASSVVIDQAVYDPSLRFLLVAGALFLLFLVLLMLSKLIG